MQFNMQLKPINFVHVGLILLAVWLAFATLSHSDPATADTLRQLDPLTIPKYVDPLVIPPVMEPVNVTDGAVEYEIAVRQFQQQILPADFPSTTVFGYGNPNDEATFNFPAFTVETRTNQTVRVTWMNQLVDDPNSDAPQYLPHLLPIDQTLHWANPGGDPDTRGEPGAGLYTGPVPIITHVHGAHVPDISDGYPEAWYLPNASNLDGFATQGSSYGSVDPAPPGEAIFEYPNDQRATTLWYHDHTLGMTLCARMDETTSPSKCRIELKGGEEEKTACQHHPSRIQKDNPKANVAASVRSTSAVSLLKRMRVSMGS